MTELSRRSLLIGGGIVVLGAGSAGAGVAGAITRHRSFGTAAAAPAPPPSSAPPSPSPSSSASPAPEPGTALLPAVGAPIPFAEFAPLPNIAVMQDVVHVPAAGLFFATQKIPGANGTSTPYESTIVNRIRASDGVPLDAMVLVDGGHGLGFEAEPDGGTTWIWMTWHGASAESGGREQDFVRLRYAPGTWTRATALQQLALTVVPFQDRTPEAVYHFDWARDSAVERHWNPPQGTEAATETFVRRRISDLRSGTDARLAEIRLRASPPTTQGFATANDSLFRWLGATAFHDAPNPADPLVLEQYSWATGQLVATAAYPSIGKPWNDGMCEPQGLSVYREADGTASLILGTTTGASGHHTWRVSRLAGIGAA